jgi:hypothetical protein
VMARRLPCSYVGAGQSSGHAPILAVHEAIYFVPKTAIRPWRSRRHSWLREAAIRKGA